jgi:hypothetical protein
MLPPTTAARRRSPRLQTVTAASTRKRASRRELNSPSRVQRLTIPSATETFSPRNGIFRTPVISTKFRFGGCRK